jgi:hypothetical protein
MPTRISALTFLESVASVMMILAAGAVLYVAMSSKSSPSTQRREMPPLTKGMTVAPVAGTDFSSRDDTVVLFVQSKCRFCTESMPFYSKLTQSIRAARDGRTQFVFVSYEPVQTTSDYLRQHEVVTDSLHVNQSSFERFPFVVSTPTLVIVDKTGRLVSGWRGRLDESTQNEVIKTLGLPTLIADLRDQ